MSTKNRFIPAFPRPASEDRQSGDQSDGNITIQPQDGMSLRDYFAGRALAGLIANSDIPDLMRGGLASEKCAEVCYVLADAMMEERTREPKS